MLPINISPVVAAQTIAVYLALLEMYVESHQQHKDDESLQQLEHLYHAVIEVSNATLLAGIIPAMASIGEAESFRDMNHSLIAVGKYLMEHSPNSSIKLQLYQEPTTKN